MKHTSARSTASTWLTVLVRLLWLRAALRRKYERSSAENREGTLPIRADRARAGRRSRAMPLSDTTRDRPVEATL